MTFDKDAEMECISCHETVKTGDEAIENGFRVIENTHDILCEMCAISIQRLSERWFE